MNEEGKGEERKLCGWNGRKNADEKGREGGREREGGWMSREGKGEEKKWIRRKGENEEGNGGEECEGGEKGRVEEEEMERKKRTNRGGGKGRVDEEGGRWMRRKGG